MSNFTKLRNRQSDQYGTDRLGGSKPSVCHLPHVDDILCEIRKQSIRGRKEGSDEIEDHRGKNQRLMTNEIHAIVDIGQPVAQASLNHGSGMWDRSHQN